MIEKHVFLLVQYIQNKNSPVIWFHTEKKMSFPLRKQNSAEIYIFFSFPHTGKKNIHGIIIFTLLRTQKVSVYSVHEFLFPTWKTMFFILFSTYKKILFFTQKSCFLLCSTQETKTNSIFKFFFRLVHHRKKKRNFTCFHTENRQEKEKKSGKITNFLFFFSPHSTDKKKVCWKKEEFLSVNL